MGSSSTSWISESNTHAGVSKVFSSSTWDAIVSSTGLKITASEATAAIIEMWADDGDDAEDKWKLDAGTVFSLQNYYGGSYAMKFYVDRDGDVSIGQDIFIAATNKIRFDGDGGHSYISESAADIISVYAGGLEILKLDETNDKVEVLGADLEIDATKKLFFDGGGNTYIHESSADVLAFVVGGTTSINFSNSGRTVNIGVDGTGNDVKFFGDTAGKYWLWDQSADGVVQQGTLTVGVDDTGYDVKLFGATSGSFMLWDESDDALELTDSTPLKIGDGGDMTIYHDGSHSLITNATGTMKLATETSGIAVSIGHTTSVTTINDELDVTGTVDINDTTDASSKTTGALKVDGGVGIAKKLYVGTDLDVDGTTNLDVVDIDGATQIDNTLSVGVNDTGYDVKFFGASAGKYWLWDESADGVVQASTLTVGVDDTGHDVKFFGATSGSYMLWDESADKLMLVKSFLEGAKVSCENVTADDTLGEIESGKMFIFTDAAAVLTLPDSGGGDLIGVTYTFISNFQGTGQEVKCSDTTNEKFVGAIAIADTDDITSAGTVTAEAAQGYSSIEFTGTTEGEPGSMFKVTNIAADVWFIEGMVLSAGTSANPFATS